MNLFQNEMKGNMPGNFWSSEFLLRLTKSVVGYIFSLLTRDVSLNYLLIYRLSSKPRNEYGNPSTRHRLFLQRYYYSMYFLYNTKE